jgi:hypothetical protein
MMRIAIGAALVVFALGLGNAFAQAPASTTPPGTQAKSDVDKKAISKSCSDQADAKGLHGDARKKFRSACKKNGGKPQ